MKATLFTGFLGAGKTTTLARILRENQAAQKFGVIVNDLSELEVDGELIRNGDLVSEKAGTLASLTGGALDGHNRDAFREALRMMKSSGVRHVLIEASGSSDPGAILEEISESGEAVPGAVVALVDCRALLHDYAGGDQLVSPGGGEESGPPTASHLLARQLVTASVIALSKSDLVDGPALEKILRALAGLNPSATLAACTYGKLDTRLFLEAAPYDVCAMASRRAGAARLTAEECDIGNTVIRDVRPFHPQRFYDYYRERLGLGIFRSKGFLWFASRPDEVLLWNQAGGAMGLEFLGTWRAAILEDSTLLVEEREHLMDQLANTHPVFGDRGCELTIIGTARDREIFCAGLQKCFCTEAEVLRWKEGGNFSDPWPKTMKMVSG